MTDLSPAAQAVMEAAHDGANKVLFDIGDDSPVPMCAAAALQAAADQVVPEQALEDVPARFVNGCCHARLQDTRAQLLAIAAELEGQ